MAPRDVEFYFDYLSPYAYFAALSLPAICERQNARLVYRPTLFAALLDHFGHRGPAEIPPKALYVFKDCARHAARGGIPFRAPRLHPFRSLTALRASLEEVSGSDQPRVVDALFRAGWGQGIDLGSDDAVTSALDGAGLDGARVVARTREPEAKAILKDATARAVERGVFGVPTMITGGELFWGKDRLLDVEEHLAGRDPLATVDLAEIVPSGVGAVRPGSR